MGWQLHRYWMAHMKGFTVRRFRAQIMFIIQIKQSRKYINMSGPLGTYPHLEATCTIPYFLFIFLPLMRLWWLWNVVFFLSKTKSSFKSLHDPNVSSCRLLNGGTISRSETWNTDRVSKGGCANRQSSQSIERNDSLTIIDWHSKECLECKH